MGGTERRTDLRIHSRRTLRHWRRSVSRAERAAPLASLSGRRSRDWRGPTVTERLRHCAVDRKTGSPVPRTRNGEVVRLRGSRVGRTIGIRPFIQHLPMVQGRVGAVYAGGSRWNIRWNSFVLVRPCKTVAPYGSHRPETAGPFRDTRCAADARALS